MLPVQYKYTLLFQDKINIIFHPDSRVISNIFEEIINYESNINASTFINARRNDKLFESIKKDVNHIIISLADQYVDYNANRIYTSNEFDAYSLYDNIKRILSNTLKRIEEKDKVVVLIDNIDRYLDIYYLQLLLDYLKDIEVFRILISAHSYDLLYLNGKGTFATTGEQYSFTYVEYAKFMVEQSQLMCLKNQLLRQDIECEISKFKKLNTYRYSFKEINWLKLHPDLLPVLFILKDMLPKYFKIQELILEVAYNCQDLMLYIVTAESPNNAQKQLEKFDNEFWLDYLKSKKYKIVIDIMSI